MPEFQIPLKKILVKKVKETTVEDNGVYNITLCKSGSLWHVFGFFFFEMGAIQMTQSCRDELPFRCNSSFKFGARKVTEAPGEKPQVKKGRFLSQAYRGGVSYYVSLCTTSQEGVR